MDKESAQPPAATDVGVDPPPYESEAETKDPTPSQNQPASAGVQTGKGNDFPEPSEEGDDDIVEYHRKGKGAKPMVVGKPPKH